MNTSDLKQLKIAWLAAEEAGDNRAQLSLLRDHPEALAELADFIAAYRATNFLEQEVASNSELALLPLTQRAGLRALERVFGQTSTALNVASLRELRARRNLSLVQAAKGLRLGVDVWKKFEEGAIDLLSLTDRQLAKLADFFQVSADQFGSLLGNSRPALALNRRQTGEAARAQQGPKKQSFAEALEKSGMSDEQKREWLEEM
jgi:transcriptional regulator with XRE-family HTH domain